MRSHHLVIVGVNILSTIIVVHGQVSTLCRPQERFLSCGGCQGTCRMPDPACAAVCRIGCYCAPGLLRNDTGHCVELSECPPSSVAYYQDTSEPKPSGNECPENEEYSFCEPCNKTCDNPNPICPAQCSRGCFCKDDLLRDRNGRCVKPELCGTEAIKPYHIKCGKNEEYRLCEPCNKTCANPNPICPAQCSRGCFCKDDLLRDRNGRCVKPELCTKSEISNYVDRESEQDAQCADRQEYKKCSCERTCNEPHGTCEECIGGCFCVDGFVKSSSGECITMDQCPKEKCPNPNEEFVCRSGCEEFCGGSDGDCNARPNGCILGCYCIEGFIRDFKNGRCITRDKCNQY